MLFGFWYFRKTERFTIVTSFGTDQLINCDWNVECILSIDFDPKSEIEKYFNYFRRTMPFVSIQNRMWNRWIFNTGRTFRCACSFAANASVCLCVRVPLCVYVCVTAWILVWGLLLNACGPSVDVSIHFECIDIEVTIERSFSVCLPSKIHLSWCQFENIVNDEMHWFESADFSCDNFYVASNIDWTLIFKCWIRVKWHQYVLTCNALWQITIKSDKTRSYDVAIGRID